MATTKKYKLTANFETYLPTRLIVNRSEEDDLTYRVKIDEFDIELNFVVEEGWRSQLKDEEHKTFGIDKVLISVTRFENIAPPDVIITPEGHRDYTQRSPYFDERLPAYKTVAREVLERAILFFKYVLWQPNQSFKFSDHDLHNPTWTDESGQTLMTGHIFIVTSIHGLPPKLGEKRFTPNDDTNFNKALQMRLRPQLHEELLSDSQTAYYEDNLRRAILELAIACEILVKQFFFAGSPIAGATFEHLEDRGSIGIRVIELIDSTAKRALGLSFREVHNEHYRNIDYLFRCRNKIAHRGEVTYRDARGDLHRVDKNEFQQWWRSLETLKIWLDSLSGIEVAKNINEGT